MIDLVLILLALICAPPMIYNIWASRRRAQGDDVPPLGDLLRATWVYIGPVLELIGYGIKRALAYNWSPTEDEKPAWLRVTTMTTALDYDELEAADEPDEAQTDQTDPVSALPDAVGALQLDRTRMAVVRVLVWAGWEAGQIRAVLKGDNGVIGQEVAQARTAPGLPGRVVNVRDRTGGRLVERAVAVD